MKEVKLFTHTDLDGVGCAVLASSAFSSPEYHLSITHVDYNNVNQEILHYLEDCQTDEFLLITDISVNAQVADRIDEMSFDNKLLLDHHGTAVEPLSKYSWCIVSPTNSHTLEKESGTSLLFQYLVEENLIPDKQYSRLKTFVNIVTAWDTWTWKANNCSIAPKLNDLLQLWGISRFHEWCKSWISCKYYPDLDDAGRSACTVLSDIKSQYIKEKASEIIMCTAKDGYDYGVVFADKYISELGNALSEQYSELEFIAIINMGNLSISFRSIHRRLDLGKYIEFKMGGGGHPQSAGALIPFECVKKIVDELLTL